MTRYEPDGILPSGTIEGREKVRPRLGLMMVFALLGALTLVTPAHAAFPGANGKIAFSESPGIQNFDIYSMNPDTTGLTRLTDDPGFEGNELPLAPTWEELGENLDGISDEQLATFRERAVPEPAGALRESVELRNAARLDVPTTAICTAFTSAEYKAAVEDGQTWLGGYGELRNVTWIDLPTSHWPMWSRPQELAAVIGDIARGAG